MKWFGWFRKQELSEEIEKLIEYAATLNVVIHYLQKDIGIKSKKAKHPIDNNEYKTWGDMTPEQGYLIHKTKEDLFRQLMLCPSVVYGFINDIWRSEQPIKDKEHTEQHCRHHKSGAIKEIHKKEFNKELADELLRKAKKKYYKPSYRSIKKKFLNFSK